jgi:hypothetical protein
MTSQLRSQSGGNASSLRGQSPMTYRLYGTAEAVPLPILHDRESFVVLLPWQSARRRVASRLQLVAGRVGYRCLDA